MRNAFFVANPPAIVQYAGGAQAQTTRRANHVISVVLDAYWETVHAMGHAQAAKLLASQGRPIPGAHIEQP